MAKEVVVESLMKSGSFWFPEGANSITNSVDGLFYFILIGSIILFVGICSTMAYFLYKYRRTEANPVATSHITHSTTLELLWTIIPLILCVIIFWWGYKDFLSMGTPPGSALEIRVIGKKWLWQFEYPKEGVKTLGELVVPVNRPIRLVMGSEDVLHSFFLPNFRIKRDVLPNRYTRLWFQAERMGNFQIFCTEYCGDGHSAMLATLRVVSEAEYQEWLHGGSGDSDEPLPELGKKLYTKNACNTCHSIDGSPSVGPTWKGMYGHKVSLDGGASVDVDDAYIKESIENPKAKIVKGFQPVMPTYAGVLREREMLAIIEYMKSL